MVNTDFGSKPRAIWVRSASSSYPHFANAVFKACPCIGKISNKIKTHALSKENLVHPFPNKPWFLCVCSTSLSENSVGKGEIARNEQFLLFPQCFIPVWKTFSQFHQK